MSAHPEPFDPAALKAAYLDALERVTLAETLEPGWDRFLGLLETAEQARSMPMLRAALAAFECWRERVARGEVSPAERPA